MKKHKIKLVIFEEPKIKLCQDTNLENFVDFYKIDSMGYGIEHHRLASIRTIQEVINYTLSIGYIHNKPDKPGKVVGELKNILLFDASFFQDVTRIKNLIKKNRRILLNHHKKEAY